MPGPILTPLKRFFYGLLPTSARIQGVPTYLRNCCLDLADRMSGQRDSELPPRRLNISGGGSFRAIGNHNLMLCRNFGGLLANDSVLDLGCGIGRTALAMSRYLQQEGRYTGLDIIKFAIRWCQENISNKHSNFRFIHADVRNRTYNPNGAVVARQFSFPLAEGTFDFCLATSLFTHLLPGDTERYVAEVGRVLRRDGRFLSTWFLLDEETIAAVKAGVSEYTFPFLFEAHAQHSIHAPEQAVAYRRSYLEAVFARAGLLIEAVHHGAWSGVSQSIDSGQDVVVARHLGETR